ncbi:MAG: hypothetical protein ACFBSD_04480 [Paracoccaceae bacterium]
MSAANSTHAPQEAIFAVYMLLAEPIRFTMRQAMEAAQKANPEFEGWQIPTPDDWLDTSAPLIAMASDVFTGKTGDAEDRHLTLSLSVLPNGIGDVDVERLIQMNPGFRDARQALEHTESYLHVAILAGKGQTDYADRFEQARLLAQFSAIFAKLPAARAVWFTPADVLMAPEHWIEAAESATAATFPIVRWMRFMPEMITVDGVSQMRVLTDGMSYFDGAEVSFAPAPVSQGDALAGTYQAVWLLLNGSPFRDGDTFGVEGDAQRLRVRFHPKGRDGASRDTWVIFHPDSPVDDLEQYGARPRPPAPEGTDNTLPADPGFLGRLLRSRRAPRQ